MASDTSRQRALRAGAWCLALAVLAACQEPAPQYRQARPGVVDVDRAIVVFREVCLATAPTFADARERHVAMGLIRAGEAGVTYDETGTLSIRVDDVDGPKGPQLRCSVVYEDPNPYIARERVDRMLTDIGLAARDHRTAQFPSTDGGLREGRAWVYAAGGRTGELIDLAYGGGGDLGILFLQFPRR